MTRFFRRLLRPNEKTRRVTAGLCAAFLLSVLLFSSFVIARDSDHDCSGRDCPVCLELQSCIGNFQLLGSALGGVAETPVSTASFGDEPIFTCAYRAPSLTLQRLDVRFDE